MTPLSSNHIPRLAVMLSGGGRTLINLLDRIHSGQLAATIPLVIASRECPGSLAAQARVPDVRIIPGEISAPDLLAILRAHVIDWVVLAGYLRYVHIPAPYRGRVVNIHPALLPRHGGAGMHGRRVHESVLAAGDSESGCTVHLADDVYDAGAIVLQRRCPVLPGDTPDTLAARVFPEECEAYPAALQLLFAKHPGPLCVPHQAT
ncbi:phosphoribosylglycinamide formyltransferase 1 [Phycisphaerales bacterium]|nr:phosphoribosylglycinamide formyltransferase 1 [Phycisphaerales bacterium]